MKGNTFAERLAAVTTAARQTNNGTFESNANIPKLLADITNELMDCAKAGQGHATVRVPIPKGEDEFGAYECWVREQVKATASTWGMQTKVSLYKCRFPTKVLVSVEALWLP